MDAVASMLYLDYGRRDGEWVPNRYGGNGNLEAMEFFKHLTSIMEKRNPRAYLIAEESTAWPDITKRAEDGGLGFKFKWNMGWMHDFLDYVQLDPYFKKFNHNKMTFNMTYCFSENFIDVLSHDEVVHLKKSMFYKMPGDLDTKAANLKTAYCFMFGQPGKKLLFMGQEFGQREEWSENRSLDWYLLDDPLHANIKEFFKRLLHLYRDNPVMYAYETKGYDGFKWINPDDADNSVFSFIRKKPDTYNDSLVFVCNFTPIERGEYVIGVPNPGDYVVELSTDDVYGVNRATYTAQKMPEGEQIFGFDYKLTVDLKGFESIIMRTPELKIRKPIRRTVKKKKK
jgi:1,4-alpha-glucan branching enzyme